MTTALTEFKPNQNNLINLENPTTIETIKNTVAKGATDAQLMTFLTMAKHYNLNPFNKEIYFSTHIGIHVGRHGMRRIAERNPLFRGLKSCPIREKDDFQVDFATGKIIKHITGLNNGKVIGAWAQAKKEGHESMPVVCFVSEFTKNNPAWKEYTQDMISYKAEVRALRNAFNSEYEGITTIEPDEELKEELRPTFAEAHSPAPASLTMSDWTGEDEHKKDKLVNNAQLARLFARANELNLTKEQIRADFIENQLIGIDPITGDYSTKTMKASDYEAAYDRLDDIYFKVNKPDKQQSLDIGTVTDHLN